MYCCPSPENLRPEIDTAFASQDKEEGCVQIAANSWTADNEKGHAKIFFLAFRRWRSGDHKNSGNIILPTY